MREWTVFRVRGDRGHLGLDATDFLSCLAALRDEFGDVRWHYRWAMLANRGEVDGLRVEVPFESASRRRIGAALERRIPPPDSIVAEPLRRDLDLDPIQTDDEMETCLALLWRWSELLCDLRTRNPGAAARQYQALTPGAFLAFVTGDRRHLERAAEEQGFGALPAVPFSRVLGLLRAMPLSYRVPPLSRDEAVGAARIHHLAGCTLAGEYYPFARSP